MTLNKIIKRARKNIKWIKKISKSRYIHLLKVASLCSKLAIIYKIDPKLAYISGIYHDYFKYLNEYENKCFMTNSEISNFSKYPDILHAFSGAIFVKYFILDDIDVYTSIKNHPWGKIDMSTLNKILLVADKSEVSRKYSDAKIIRKVAYKNLDKAVYLVLQGSIDFLKRKNLTPHRDQITLCNLYKETI